MSKVIDYFDLMSRDEVWGPMVRADLKHRGLDGARRMAWVVLLDCKRPNEYMPSWDAVADLRQRRRHG